MVVFVVVNSILFIIPMKSQVSECHNFTFAHISNEIATFTGARFEVGGLEGIQARRILDKQIHRARILAQSGSGSSDVPTVISIYNSKFITIDIKRFINLSHA